MEIINLFILLSIYYLLYFLEFYQKFLLIIGSSMFVSLLTHHKQIEEKSKDTEDYRFIYFALHNIIQLTFFVCSSSYKLYNNIFKIEFVKSGHTYLKKVNDFYVIGRNKILKFLSSVLFSAVVPFPPMGMANNQSTINNRQTSNLEVKDKQNVFKDSSDMNNFLDSLVKEKAN